MHAHGLNPRNLHSYCPHPTGHWAKMHAHALNPTRVPSLDCPARLVSLSASSGPPVQTQRTLPCTRCLLKTNAGAKDDAAIMRLLEGCLVGEPDVKSRILRDLVKLGEVDPALASRAARCFGP